MSLISWSPARISGASVFSKQNGSKQNALETPTEPDDRPEKRPTLNASRIVFGVREDVHSLPSPSLSPPWQASTTGDTLAIPFGSGRKRPAESDEGTTGETATYNNLADKNSKSVGEERALVRLGHKRFAASQADSDKPEWVRPAVAPYFNPSPRLLAAVTRLVDMGASLNDKLFTPDEADLKRLLYRPSVLDAVSRDENFSQRLQQSVKEHRQSFYKAAMAQADSPVWRRIMTNEKDFSPVELQHHAMQVDDVLTQHLKNATAQMTRQHLKAVRTLMDGRTRIAQLTPAEKIERATLEVLFHSQMAHLQAIADKRLTLFHRFQLHRFQKETLPRLSRPSGDTPTFGGQIKGAGDSETPATRELRSARERQASVAANAELSQELRATSNFQAELNAYKKQFQQGLKAVILGVIANPAWVKAMTSDSEAEKNTQITRLNNAIRTYMQQSVKALQAEFKKNEEAVFQGNSDLAKQPIQKLPADLQRTVLGLHLQMEARQAFLKDFDMQAYVAQLHQAFAQGQGAGGSSLFRSRMATLQRSAGAEFSNLIARCKSKDAEVQITGFQQLLSALMQSSKPADRRTLQHTIRAVEALPIPASTDENDSSPQVEAMKLKMQAAGAIMRLPKDQDKVALLQDWLQVEHLENCVAALKLFSFAQGVGAGSTAYRLVTDYPELRDAINALRSMEAEPIQDALGLLDQYFAMQAAKEQRAAAGQTGRDRIFRAP